jgi:uncharacterized protein YegP (UPF0339 family)
MYFEVYQELNSRQWRWRLKAANHRIIADSAEPYTSKQACLHGLGLVKGATNIPIYKA